MNFGWELYERPRGGKTKAQAIQECVVPKESTRDVIAADTACEIDGKSQQIIFTKP